MRCFTCNTPSKGHFCGSCSGERAARASNASVWDARVPAKKEVANQATSSTFADKLAKALIK